MYKGSIDIATINKSMKIKFNLIIKDDEAIKKVNGNSNKKLIDTFQYRGSEYLKVTPRPYVTIDISKSASDKDANNEMVWNANSQVNLNKITLYDLLDKLNKTINEFYTIKDLFFIKDDKIYVNKERSNENVKIISTNSKTIFIRHSVVIDPDDGREYEGIAFYINESANFCTLTYKELKYLYYELSKINMHELSMQLINTYLMINLSGKQKYKELKFNNVINEEKTEEKVDVSLPKEVKPNTIPDNI